MLEHLDADTKFKPRAGQSPMLVISRNISLDENEIEFRAIRAQGAGGQNVNKVSSAIHLRFDIRASSLPEFYKQRLLNLRDHRINKDGIIIIKAQEYRTQEKNKQAALDRLKTLIRTASAISKKRKPTRPSLRAKQKRLDNKAHHARKKSMRRNPVE